MTTKVLSGKAPRPMQEFVLLQEVSRAQGPKETRVAFRALKKFRPRTRSLLFAKGMFMQRTRGLQAVLSQVSRMRGTRAAILLSSVGKKLTDAEFQALLETYLLCNQKEASYIDAESRRVRAIYEDKATALATAILSAATVPKLEPLRRMFERIILTPSAQHYVLALLSVGKPKDVLGIIKKVEQQPTEIRYW